MTEKRIIYEGVSGVAQRVILCDENGDPYVASGGVGGGGAANDREFVTTTYLATDDGTGYTAGDTITATRVYDADGATITVVGSTIWFNETTSLALASAPTSGHLSTGAANAATEATQAQVKTAVENVDAGIDTANEALTGIDSTLLARIPAATTPGLLPVDTLGTAGVARQLAAGATSASTALTTTCRRITIHANGAAIRYAIGTGTQTASSTSHFIASGERLDWDVPANAQIGVIRAGSTDGVLEVSELV